MEGDPKVIEYLNAVLKNALTAINQYFLHYRMREHWGVKKRAKFEYGESIDDMKHAHKVSERILYRAGLPNFQLLGRLRPGDSPEPRRAVQVWVGTGSVRGRQLRLRKTPKQN